MTCEFKTEGIDPTQPICTVYTITDILSHMSTSHLATDPARIPSYKCKFGTKSPRYCPLARFGRGEINYQRCLTELAGLSVSSN